MGRGGATLLWSSGKEGWLQERCFAQDRLLTSFAADWRFGNDEELMRLRIVTNYLVLVAHDDRVDRS